MIDTAENARRWRLILGGDEADGTGVELAGADLAIDQALGALYDGDRSGGLGGSAPRLTQWLGEIRQHFAPDVVRILQQDAIDRLGLTRLLMEPEVLETIEPDVALAAKLIGLSRQMPDRARDTARQVVQKLVDELIKRLDAPMQQAVRGALNRAIRNNRPRRPAEIDWPRTIRANLKSWQPDRRIIIPERLVGIGAKARRSLQDIILCVDQSGSMATSVVYAGIFAAVLAKLPMVTTRLVVFDTAVVDYSELLAEDPIELLFSVQLGGGTDINKALTYCQQLVTRPDQTTMVLISDLYEGGRAEDMLKRAASIIGSGVNLVTLLALNDDGAPSFDQKHASTFASMGSPAFACAPDDFPDLMATALKRQDISSWAAARGIVTSRAAG